MTIWPDHDEPGAGYAAKVAELVTLAGAEGVRTVEVPGDWPKGWDLADPLPDGVAPGRLAELLDDAPDGVAAELPPGFRMTPKGLFFPPTRQRTTRRVCPTSSPRRSAWWGRRAAMPARRGACSCVGETAKAGRINGRSRGA